MDRSYPIFLIASMMLSRKGAESSEPSVGTIANPSKTSGTESFRHHSGTLE
jgi:hypothetical protein